MTGNIYSYLISIIVIGFLIYLLIKLFSKYSRVKRGNPFIYYKKVNHGYITLSNSLYHNCNKKDLEEDIKSILVKRTDGRYMGGYSKETDEFDLISFSLDSFYDFLRYSVKREKSMILDLNKDVSLEELNSFFIDALDNHVEDKKFINNYLYNASFPYEKLLSNYQKELNKSSILLGFFSDFSDSSYLFIFPLSKEQIIKNSISDIGFEYKRVPIVQEKVNTEYKQKVAIV